MALRLSVLGMAVLCAGPAQAEEDVTGRLAIELNAVETVDGACRMSFVVVTGHASDIDAAVFEAVLFDSAGGVDRLTLFDFGRLPAARPRVRQFVVPDLACDGLGQVLINGAERCEPAGGTGDVDLCIDTLQLSTRVAVGVMG